MKFVCYDNWDHLPASAELLFTQGANNCVFYSRPWFELLTTNLNDEQALALACVVEGESVLAILPLITSSGKSWYALKHPYTPHYSLLLADVEQQQVLACLARGLSELPFIGLVLEPIDREDNNLLTLQHELQSIGFSCNHTFKHYNWILRLQGQSFADYMAERPARLRNTISRKTRKLEREHGFEIRLYCDEDVPAYMADYYATYTASWKANEQRVDFVDDMVARFSREGWCRLAVLYIKEKPAAAQLWLVHNSKASIFRLSYDQAWKAYSVGSILTAYLMEYVIDTDKVKEVDFLTGNDTYKQDWMSERRERYAFGCVKNISRKNHYQRFKDYLKNFVKK